MDQYDAFLIIANEPNVASRGFKFPKQMLYTLQDPNYQPDFLLDFFIEEQIKNKRSWRKQMEEMAIENGISYEEMMDRYLHDRNFRF